MIFEVEKKIPQSIKLVLSQHVVIFPYTGNLTAVKKLSIANKLLDIFNNQLKKDKSIEYTVDMMMNCLFNSIHAQKAKNIIYQKYGDKANLLQGNSFSKNIPADSVLIIE